VPLLAPGSGSDALTTSPYCRFDCVCIILIYMADSRYGRYVVGMVTG